MKRQRMTIITILAVLLLLSSVFVSRQMKIAREESIMTAFSALLTEEANLTEIIEYVDGKIKMVSNENKVTLIDGVEKMQRNVLSRWQQRFEDNLFQTELLKVFQSTGQIPTDPNAIHDDTIKEYVLELTRGGFKIDTAEGVFYPVIDYSFYNKYHSFLPAHMVAYFEIMSIESEETPAKDAALLISWYEIYSRIARLEEFINEYGTFPQAENVEQLAKRYVYFALYGTDNTPLFSNRTKRMVHDAKQAIQEFEWDEENGYYSALIKEYYTVLEENDYLLNDAVSRFRESTLASF